MTNTLIALLTAISAAVWVYAKISRRTGGNQQTSLTVGGVVGLFIFIITLATMSMIS